MSIHGVLLVDKQRGVTSHDVVARLRKILGIRSIGHAGTLDPAATGLMICLIGEATKISDYLLNNDKGYDVEILFGIETDTLDMDGEILRNEVVELDVEKIHIETMKLIGPLELEVPAYSAVKVKGQKLVDKARKSLDFECPVRTMEFIDIDINEVTPKSLNVFLQCEKGAYVRAWAKHLGERLGCGAVVKNLHRTFSSPFYVEQAVNLDELEKLNFEPLQTNEQFSNLIGPGFVNLPDCLPSWAAFTVTGRDEKLMSNGQIPNDLSKRLIHEQKAANHLNRAIGIKIMEGSTGNLLSVVEVHPRTPPKIKRVFRYN